MFNKVYDGAVHKYTEAIRDTASLLDVKAFHDDSTQCAATTTFVDDLATTYVSPVPDGLNDVAMLGNLELDKAIDEIHMKQNLDKAQSVAQCRGKGSHTAYSNIANAKHGLVTSARCLGPHLHWSGSTSVETHIRVTQAWGSYYMYKRFWKRDVRMSFKKDVFIAAAASTLMSGLTSFVLNKHSTHIISSCLLAS